MQIPKREDMHWLSVETQKDVDRLYALYEKANKCMIPLHELHQGKVLYLLVYITDSGVSPFMKELLASAAGREVSQTGDVVKVLVDSLEFDLMYCSAILDGDYPIKFCWANYGRSWRLCQVI